MCEEHEQSTLDQRMFEFDFRRSLERKAAEGTSQSGAVSPERLIRFHEEKQRQRDGTIEKLRLRNGTLRGQILRTLQLIKEKEEKGEVQKNDMDVTVEYD